MRISKLRRNTPGRLALGGLCLLFSGAVFAAKELPEVDADGLHHIQAPKAAIVYAKPGLDLGQYDKVMILECYVQFRENWKREYNLDQIGLDGRVTDRDVERIRSELAEEFHEVFSEVLVEDGHPVVTEPGPGVLLIRPAIINLDVAAPDIMRASRSNTWVSSAGSMTLYLELYDAESSEILARVADPKHDPDFGGTRSSGVSNRAAAVRILKAWAKALSDHLSTVQGVSAG